MSANLKISRAGLFVVLAAVNAANLYLVPLIPIMGLGLFSSAVLSALVVYLTTEAQETPAEPVSNGQTQS